MKRFRTKGVGIVGAVLFVVAACTGSNPTYTGAAPWPAPSRASTTGSPETQPAITPVAPSPTVAATPSVPMTHAPSSTRPTISPSSTATTTPSASEVVPSPLAQPSPLQPPAPISLQWTRLSDGDLPAVGTIFEVTSGQGRFLVSGSGALMASADGTHWSILGTAPGSVYDDPRGLFAFGSGTTNEGSKTELWWSADGSNWQSLTDQPIFSSGPCAAAGNPITGIYPIGDTLMAVGSAAALSSQDGRTWKCLGQIPELRINGGHDILVGSGATNPQSPIDYLWSSPDGSTWHQTTETWDFMNPAPVQGGFVALGQ